mmetsp:Transcript_22754/g.36868  ORF Transcript_22754/g.36868 Transcript_22754/m.36868 type:complete len:209 (-) Transcript_22754:1060-1686(-)
MEPRARSNLATVLKPLQMKLSMLVNSANINPRHCATPRKMDFQTLWRGLTFVFTMAVAKTMALVTVPEALQDAIVKRRHSRSTSRLNQMKSDAVTLFATTVGSAPRPKSSDPITVSRSPSTATAVPHLTLIICTPEPVVNFRRRRSVPRHKLVRACRDLSFALTMVNVWTIPNSAAPVPTDFTDSLVNSNATITTLTRMVFPMKKTVT